jgi:hypothetical protein
MRTIIITALILSSILNSSFTSPNNENDKLNFNGIYAGKTGEIDIPGNKMEIFNYIRFYDDGTVYTQAVNSYDPPAVSKWFGKEGKFERSGTYEVSESHISFSVSNDNSPDKQLEGARTDKYQGEIMRNGNLSLTITYASGESKEVTFEFIKIE